MRNLEQQIAFAQHVMSYQPEIGKHVFKTVFTIDFLKTDAAAVLKSKLLRHQVDRPSSEGNEG